MAGRHDKHSNGAADSISLGGAASSQDSFGWLRSGTPRTVARYYDGTSQGNETYFLPYRIRANYMIDYSNSPYTIAGWGVNFGAQDMIFTILIYKPCPAQSKRYIILYPRSFPTCRMCPAKPRSSVIDSLFLAVFEYLV